MIILVNSLVSGTTLKLMKMLENKKNMDFDKFIGKDFLPKNGVEFLINNYLKPSTF